MTKRKPEMVIEYRISLQDKDREMLETVGTAYSVNKIANPIITALSDASFMLLAIPLLYSIFAPDKDMEKADPVLFAAITGGPTELFQNLALWYGMRRKQIIEENEQAAEQITMIEQQMLSGLPGIGPLLGFLFRR